MILLLQYWARQTEPSFEVGADMDDRLLGCRYRGSAVRRAVGIMFELRLGRSPWLWGSLGVAALLVALAIQADVAGFFAIGAQTTKASMWVERASWLAAIVALSAATVAARQRSGWTWPPTRQPGHRTVARQPLQRHRSRWIAPAWRAARGRTRHCF